ncbi:related to peroxisomal membrane protein [Ramularia collo-cygni]|uniref:Related to peroxisomal membrane protein n=1 Tax=Ramularia collo-cygni TaxID=112498 RepID=A0A2D3USL0_9PEZI|nr:related to peroxisomal membrane protein [Ramularia collo-cygni]CZT15670.1 related to peroxisomal membrane protein [Ramularia collo-cygni]
MAPLKVGDKFPSDVKFEWAPITDPDPTACGVPQAYDASKEFAGKRVVIVSVPGAFTPGCQARHIPPYIQQIDELVSKGVDLVVVIASNDCWVMAAWAKVNGVGPDSKILFMSDTKSFFSKNHGWDAGMGDRNGRWAMIVEKDGTISAADVEESPRNVTVSGADAVLSKL